MTYLNGGGRPLPVYRIGNPAQAGHYLLPHPQLPLEGEAVARYRRIGERRHADAAPGHGDMVIFEHLRRRIVLAHALERSGTNSTVAERQRPYLGRSKKKRIFHVVRILSLSRLNLSKYKRQDTFSAKPPELVAELGLVTFTQGDGAGREVGERPQGEYRPRPRPCEYREPYPLHELAEIVGRTHPAEHSAVRDMVSRIAGAAEVPDDMVGVYVDDHAGDENGRPDDELRGFEPSRRIEPLRRISSRPA